MKKHLIPLLLLVLVACKKERSVSSSYGCVYGKAKTTGERTFIRCSFREIYLAGRNQTAADKIAADKGLPRENVTNMADYTEWEYIATTDCNCR